MIRRPPRATRTDTLFPYTTLFRSDRGDHDLGGDALVAQAQGLFERDLVKGVGRRLDAIGDHAGAVRLDLDADVVVHHALVGDEDLHRCGIPVRRARPPARSEERRGGKECGSTSRYRWSPDALQNKKTKK